MQGHFGQPLFNICQNLWKNEVLNTIGTLICDSMRCEQVPLYSVVWPKYFVIYFYQLFRFLTYL